MKRFIIFISMVIIVIGMLAGFRVFVSEESYDGAQTAGEALMEMEHESDKRVETLRGEIESGVLAEADCRIEIQDMVLDILDNLSQVKEGAGSYLNTAYNCNVIRKLALALEDREDMTKAELELKEDNLTVFAGEVFNYCLDISRNIEEEADYMRLTAWAEEIEGELDKEVERYTGLVYAWYIK